MTQPLWQHFTDQMRSEHKITEQHIINTIRVRQKYGITIDDLTNTDLVGQFVLQYKELDNNGNLLNRSVLSSDLESGYLLRTKQMWFIGLDSNDNYKPIFLNSNYKPETKQVIIARKDLRMPKGKLAAQVAHASMAPLLDTIWHVCKLDDFDYVPTEDTIIGRVMAEWLNNSFTKIVLEVDSLDQLEYYHNLAKECNVPTKLIIDNGTTVFNGVKTPTCCSIGPFWNPIIDNITKKLKLYT